MEVLPSYLTYQAKVPKVSTMYPYSLPACEVKYQGKLIRHNLWLSIYFYRRRCGPHLGRNRRGLTTSNGKYSVELEEGFGLSYSKGDRPIEQIIVLLAEYSSI